MNSRPAFDLEWVQNLVRLGEWRAEKKALLAAAAMKLEPKDVRDCVLELTAADFYKTDESRTYPGRMFDVYKPTYCGTRVYLKIQMEEDSSKNRTRTVVISFHECD